MTINSPQGTFLDAILAI